MVQRCSNVGWCSKSIREVFRNAIALVKKIRSFWVIIRHFRWYAGHLRPRVRKIRKKWLEDPFKDFRSCSQLLERILVKQDTVLDCRRICAVYYKSQEVLNIYWLVLFTWVQLLDHLVLQKAESLRFCSFQVCNSWLLLVTWNQFFGDSVFKPGVYSLRLVRFDGADCSEGSGLLAEDGFCWSGSLVETVWASWGSSAPTVSACWQLLWSSSFNWLRQGNLFLLIIDAEFQLLTLTHGGRYGVRPQVLRW